MLVSRKIAFVAAATMGLTALAGPSAGFAQSGTAQSGIALSRQGTPATVQLNADTAVSRGLTNKYTNDDANVALGLCVIPGSASAPASTIFSSPVLTFTNYSFEPTLGVAANVSADAKLKPGTRSGMYPLIMTCDGKRYRATFVVPRSAASQVSKVPSGAARAGGGGTAN